MPRYGDELAIRLQIADGASGLFPTATILAPDDTILEGPIDLVHSLGGLYKPSATYTMPNQKFIDVQYAVYTNSGHTTDDPVNGRYVERFDLEECSTADNCVDLEAELAVIQLAADIQVIQLEAEIESVEFSVC